jgi:hypothetical protein
MRKMSWTHYSKTIVIGVLLAVLLTTAGTAAAISFTGEAPDPADAGEEVTMEVTVEEPFTGQPNQWTLRGETDLENANWFIEVRDTGGSIVEQQEPGGDSVEQALNAEDGTTEVTIEVSGEIPEIDEEELNYENIDEERYTALELLRTDDGQTTLETWRSHRWQADSRHEEARQTLDDASDALEGVSDESIQADFDNAKAFYNQGDFDRAISLAEDAQTQAEQGGGGDQLLLIGGGLIVVLLLAGGGVYYYRSGEDDSYKLQ